MEETLVIVKPDAYAKRYTWDIIKEYSDAGI
jgi:nucleoside diphosphate kinase